MAYKIQLRRDTAANWSSVNPILADGEMGFETDTRKFKLGNGLTVWNSLQYGVSGDIANDAIWDALGDLAVGTGADTSEKLTVGSNGQILSADDGETTGLKWINEVDGGGA